MRSGPVPVYWWWSPPCTNTLKWWHRNKDNICLVVEYTKKYIIHLIVFSFLLSWVFLFILIVFIFLIRFWSWASRIAPLCQDWQRVRGPGYSVLPFCITVAGFLIYLDVFFLSFEIDILYHLCKGHCIRSIRP